MSGKQERVLAALKKNSQNLGAFNNLFQGKADRKRKEIVERFVKECGCLPTDAEICIGPDPDQSAGETVVLKIWVQHRDHPKVPVISQDPNQ
jgi:hypothetical protein